MDTLSKRGIEAMEAGRSDMELFFDALKDSYDPIDNPGGKFALNVAENVAMIPHIVDRIEHILSQGLPAWTMKYTSALGNEDVREKIAVFMQQYFKSASIVSESLVLSSGAAASLEVLSFVLSEPGDVVVIPAPAYPVYTADLGVKSRMERYDVQTHYDIAGINDLAIINITRLREALEDIQASGKRFRMLMLTSPDNPSGSIYDLDELTYMAEWCVQHNVHMVVNEIYHLTRIESPSIDEISSFAQVMSEMRSPYLHLIYGLSKDFCMSGFRVGIIHTLNKVVIEALDTVNVPHMASNITQHVVGELLSDKAYIDNYIRENHEALLANYTLVISTLKELNIPFIPSKGGLFIWIDLSAYMNRITESDEVKLWRDIYDHTGVLFTPGNGFGHKKHGLFRIVFSAFNYKGMEVAMRRVKKFFSNRKKYNHQ